MKLSPIAAMAASVMLAAFGVSGVSAASASESHHAPSVSETRYAPLCHRQDGSRICLQVSWSGGIKMPALSAPIPEGSKNPKTIIVGDPFWINTTPGVEAFAIPTSCSPGCLQMWPFDFNGNPQTSNLNVTWSVNGVITQYDRLSMQDDGNFVFYNLTNGRVWAPPDVRPNGFWAIFQNDGNLVVYNSASEPLWAAGTYNHPDAFLAFQSDGNMVIYPSTSNMRALWATGTE
jgi:hypothetical protein